MKEDCSFILENEFQLHVKVVEAIRKYYPHALLAVQCGENQDSINKRINSAKKGYVSGSPDLLICNKHLRYTGFAIEFKTPKGTGRLSENQKGVLSQYQHAGYQVLVSNDFVEILHAIFTYFRGVRLMCPHCEKRFCDQSAFDRHLCCARKPIEDPSSSDE